VATNDLMYLLEGLGVSTGVDKESIMGASMFIQEKIGKPLPSRSLQTKPLISEPETKPETNKEPEKSWEKSGDTIKINPQHKREHIYFFFKNQYDKFRSKNKIKRIMLKTMLIQEKIGKPLPSRSLQTKPLISEPETKPETNKEPEKSWEKSGDTIKINPQHKREHIYFFFKNQYDKFRSKN